MYDNLFQIVPGGIAALSGKLRMGDRILKVNGSDVTGATHQEAVTELLRPCDEIKLTVQHDPLPAGFQVRFIFFTILETHIPETYALASSFYFNNAYLPFFFFWSS